MQKVLSFGKRCFPEGLNLHIYIGIALFIYCFIACLKHGGIAFFISIFYFCSLLRPLFFYYCGCRLSIIWLFTVQRYGGSVRYQTPGDALFGWNFSGTPSTNVAHLGFPKNFLPNCLVFWLLEPPFLNARKKAIWWRDDGMIKKISDQREQKTVKGNESSNPE